MNIPRLLLALTLLAPVACKVVADGAPTTPPDVELKYRVGDGSTWIDVLSDTSITVGTNDVLYLYACASDDEGVAIVIIDGGGNYRCATGGAGTSSDPGGVTTGAYSFYAENRSSAAVGESTLEDRVLTAAIAMYEVCDEGNPAGSVLTYTAVGVLFDPTLTGDSPTLTVTVD